MSVNTTPVPAVSLPNEEELRKVAELLGEATEYVSDLAWRVRRLADDRDELEDTDEAEPHRRQLDDPIPTKEDLGRLFAAGVTFRSYLEEMSSYIKDMTGPDALERLDYVRVTFPYRNA
jgi:hypothetical protein